MIDTTLAYHSHFTPLKVLVLLFSMFSFLIRQVTCDFLAWTAFTIQAVRAVNGERKDSKAHYSDRLYDSHHVHRPRFEYAIDSPP